MTSPQEEWDAILEEGLSGLACCSHASQEDIDRVRKTKREVLFAWRVEGYWGSEHEMGALVELSDAFAVIYEGEDTSGHGCQCSGDLSFFSTLDEATRMGLNANDRAEFRKAARGGVA